MFPRFAEEFSVKVAADVLGIDATPFEKMQTFQDASGGGAYAPFTDCEKWELAQWLIKNVNQRATEEFLKLPILPTGPEWTCRLIHIHGDHGPIDNDAIENPQDDDVEELKLWMWDPVACVQELIGNPAFCGSIAYTPEKVYTDREGQTRRYDEMWTANWWWKTQARIPAGAMVAPVILASDKTELSWFKGNKTAWPMYLTIGNLSKDVRRYCLFHYCMKLLLQPLVDAGRNGMEMVCADGYIHRIFLILAAFIGDHPEQCWVANEGKIFSSRSATKHKQPKLSMHRPPTNTHPSLLLMAFAQSSHPFGLSFPILTFSFASPPTSSTSYIHQGIVKDHLKKWCSTLAETAHFDACFQAMPIFLGLRHFKNGISTVKQWTATDHKQLERVFIGALVGAIAEPHVLQATRCLINFVHLAQYHSHTDDTLMALQHALNDFHRLKDVFIELGCRDQFNIPKFHLLVHYTDTIRNLGSLDGLNTETSERLHIDFAKKAYAATSRKDYTIQMTRWLQRQEAAIWFSGYLAWHHKTRLTDMDLFLSSDSDPESYLQDLQHRPVTALCVSQCYRISQQPQFPKKTIQYLEQHHGAAWVFSAQH
ncbi:hypothetical protein V8E55_010224 [Tylopilus felleus]